jgi:hypothetical protein
MAAQWANHARAGNTHQPQSAIHSAPFAIVLANSSILWVVSRCLRAAAAVKTRLLAHIEKKPRAPSADRGYGAGRILFAKERLNKSWNLGKGAWRFAQ